MPTLRRPRSGGAARLSAILALFLLAPAPALAQGRPLDHDAYDRWKSITGERISDDGAWVLYHLEPRVGDGELVVTLRGEDERRIDRATGARFTPDSRYAVFTIRPAYDSVRTLRLAETPRSELPSDTLGILDLATGEVLRVPDVESWRMAEEAGAVVAWLVESEPDTAEAEPAEGEEPEGEPGEGPEKESEAADEEARDKPDTYTLVVRQLGVGAEQRYEDVVAFRVSEDGRRIVYTASSEDGLADGVFLVDVATGERRALLSGEGLYEGLTLHESGARVAFLTDRDDFHAKQPSYALYHWADGMEDARRVAWEGADGVPAGWWVSEHEDPRYSDSGDRLYFGTAPRPAPEPEDTLLAEEEVRLDLWHWQDEYLQPMQLLNVDDERERSYRAVAHLDRGDRVVQLATESLPEIELTEDGDARWALAESDVPYRRLVGIEAPGYTDLWVVDVETGERRQVVQGGEVVAAHLSPDGEYVAWYDAGSRHWYAQRPEGAEAVNLTDGVPYPIWDEEDDHPMPPYPYGLAGWTEGDTELLVYDRYDIWAVDPEGRRTPRRITEGAGRDRGLELRYVELDREAESIERDEPLLLSAFDVTTKESGYFRDRVTGTAAPEQLLYAPKYFGRPAKADDAPVLLYTREDVAEFPDLWVATSSFGDPVRVTDANPQQAEYNWATAELVEWLSEDGVPLQGLLYKPEDFDPTREYPMMVYFYERNSDNLYRHFPPLPHRSVIRPTFYASRGYIVFIPDIVYEDGYPGESAMDAVMPGTLMLAAEPWVDEDNVGVQGHSWGGYQIAYMVTQTDFFKAAEAGAPVSNMTSAYGGIRWGSGLSRVFQYEDTQSRIGATLWEARDRYIENSPLFYLDQVETPLLIMHNDEDGAVPWYQGIELFVGLRRLNKPAWMVVYNDQPHWPTTEAMKRDWNIRMQQYFDHFLKGAPAPRWLTDGIPATDKGRTLGLEVVAPAPLAEPETDRGGGR